MTRLDTLLLVTAVIVLAMGIVVCSLQSFHSQTHPPVRADISSNTLFAVEE